MTPTRVVVERRREDHPPPTPQPTPCVLWQGPLNSAGYGKRPDQRLIHAWTWEQINGPVPEGMVVRHKCDLKICFRYSHLELGTTQDNIDDMVERGRANRFGDYDQSGEKGTNSKLTDDQVRAIRADDRTHRTIAQDYGISDAQVSRIKSRQQWRHIQ